MKTRLLLIELLLLGFITTRAQPNTISGLTAWYSSDSVSVKSGYVTIMYDKSGSNNNAVQPTAGEQPSYLTNQINGRPVVHFNGGAGLETTGNVNFSNTPAITAFMVYRDLAVNGQIQVIYEHSDAIGASNNPQAFAYVFRGDLGNEEVIAIGGDNVSNTANDLGIATVMRNTNFVLSTELMNKSPSPAVPNIYFSGQLVSTNSTQQTYTTDFNAYPLNIGARDNASQFQWTGDIAELIFYNRALTTAEQNEVEQYLRLKYAPQINLGANIVKTYGVCAVNLNIGSGFTKILWSNGDTASSINITKSGKYWVTADDMFGYTSTDTISVTLPFLGLNSNDTSICLGSSLNLQPVFTNAGKYTYLWSNNDTSQTINASVAGAYYVKVTDTSGCYAYSDTITVGNDTFPEMRVIGKDTSICQNASIGITSQAQSLEKSVLWSTGATTPVITINTGGNVSVTVTDNNGCVARDTMDVTLSGVAPNTAFIYDTVCSGNPTQFTNQSKVTGTNSIVKLFWNFGDGDTVSTSDIASEQHTYANGGAYSVMLTAYTQIGCQSTVTNQVPVNPSPIVSFNNTTGCINVPYSFQNNTIAGSGDSIISWLWNFGDGQTSNLQSPQHDYSTVGSYNVSLQVSTLKGCSVQEQQTVGIVTSALPPVGFSLSQPVNGYVTGSNTVTFSWSAGANAVTYTLTLSSNAAFTNILNRVGTSSLRATVNVGTDTTVYWRVTAYNSCGDSTISETYLLNVFNASSISCLKFWVDGSNVVTNNNNVTQWTDLSGYGTSAVQSNAADQPTLLTNQINGYSVVHFNGSSDGLATSSNIDFSGTAGITVFLVYRDLLLNGTDQIIYEHSDAIGANNNPQAFAYVYRPDLDSGEAIAIGGDNVSNSTNDLGVTGKRNTNFILSTELMNKYPSPAVPNVYLSGQLVSTNNNPQSYSTDFAAYQLNIGARDNAGSYWWTGDIAEMLMYCNALTTVQQTEVQQYLRFKYAAQINLGFDTTIAYGFCPFNLTIPPTVTNILWSNGDTGHTISVNQSGKYSATGTDAFGYTTTDTINVNYPFEGLNFIDTTICLGGSVTIYPRFVFPGNYRYLWNNGDTTSSISATKAGPYSCKITDANGCSIQSDTAKVVIDSFAVNRLFAEDTTLCKFSNFSVNPPVQPLISKISWSTGDSTESITLSSSGDLVATATDIAGCSATDTIVVHFSGTAPTTSFTNTSDCSGASMSFSNQSTAVSPDMISRSHWNFGDGDTSNVTSPSHVYANAGIYNVSLTTYTKDGCQGTYTTTVTVNPAPVVNFNNSTGCINTPYQFIDLSIPGSGDTIDSWGWSFGNGNTSQYQNPTNSYNTPSAYNVTLTVQTDKGCTASVTKQVTIVAGAMPPGPLSLLLPLNNFVTGSNSVSFSWNSSANAVLYRLTLATDPYLEDVFSTQFTTGTSYPSLTMPYDTVYWQVTAFNSCNDSSSSSIYALYIFKAINTSCLKFWVDGGSIQTNGVNVVSWNDKSFNGTSAVQNQISSQPTVVANGLNGNSIVHFDGSTGLRTNDNVDFSGTKAITIFMVYKDLLINGTDQIIYEHSNSAGSNPQSFAYSFRSFNEEQLNVTGDGTTTGNTISDVNSNITRDTNFVLSTQLMDKSANPATANIYFSGQLVSSPSQDYTYYTNFDSFPLNIGARDNASTANWGGDIAEMMMYCTALDSTARYGIEQYLRYKYAPQIYLGPDIRVAYGVCDTTLSIGPYFKNIRWSTGDSSNSIVVKQGGTYWVTANDLFGYITSDTVLIGFPYQGSNVGSTAAICLNDSLLLIQQIQPTNAYSFLWQNGSTSDSIYAKTPGAYYTQITDTNHCVLHTDTITVGIDSFQLQTILNDTSVCSGNDIGISLNGYHATSILWSNNDTSAVIAATTAGTYSVTVTDINGCIAQGSAQIAIHGQAPSVNFKVQNICLGDTTQLTDLSIAVSPDAISYWQWTFGDGDSSNTENPGHFYAQLGDFNVQLYVLTDSGCSGAETMQVDITPSPKADFYYPSTALICAGDTEQFYSTSTILLTDTIAQTRWVFNTIDTFYATSVTYAFPAQGDVPVKLLVTSKEGCSDSFSTVLEVFPPLIADFEATNVCFGDSTSFIDITHSFSVVSWEWTFGDGSFFSTVQDPKHEYADTGIYNVTMTVINAIGCTSTASQAVNIVEPPTAAFTNLVACVNSFYSPVDSSISPDEPITQWVWNINGKIFNTETPSYYFADTGIYRVGLAVTSKSGCADSTGNSIEIFPAPVAEFTFAPLYGAAPLTVAFTNESTGAVSFGWNFGDGSQGSFDENPTYTYTQNDTFNIVLSVASAYGCSDSTSKILIVSQTYLDLAVTAVQTNSVIQPDGSSLVSVTAVMANLGTRLITGITLDATLGSGGEISEQWNGVFESGTTMDYTFASQFVIGTSIENTYICVDAVSVNNGETETDTVNNIQCASLTGGIQLIGPSPDPAFGNAYLGIILPEAGQVTIDVSDVAGKFIAHNVVLNLQAGRTDYLIPAGQMQSGQYVLRLQYDDNIYTRRFIVQ